MITTWFSKNSCRKAMMAVVLGIGTLACAGTALAQYGSSVHYHNPRTGFSYSQSSGVGNHWAYGGFSYSQNGRSYSTGSGYYGRNHYQHQTYVTPSYAHGYSSRYGNGYYPRQSSGCRR